MPISNRLVLAAVAVALVAGTASAQVDRLKRVYRSEGKTSSKPMIPEWDSDRRKSSIPVPKRQKLSVEDQKAALNVAVERLIAEARELDQPKKPNADPVLYRPHPLLTNVSGEIAGYVLDRMNKPFLGNEYRDTYIRWHLVHVLKTAEAEQMRQAGRAIIELIQKMPGPLEVELRDAWDYEPPELGRQWLDLHDQTKITVGYPPFDRVYYGEEALEHATPEEKKRIAPIVEQMKKIQDSGKLVHVVDEDIRLFNHRVRKVNWMVRQYRGELIYALLQTGDPAVLDKVIAEIARRVRLNDRAAFDLTAFVYLAAFDGVLARYESEDLQRAGKAMEVIARSAEGYKLYTNGQFPLPRWALRKERNFADYAFHITHMLQQGSNAFEGMNAASSSGGGE